MPIAKKRNKYLTLFNMCISEKIRVKTKKIIHGIKIRIVGKFLLDFTCTIPEVKIPVSIPIEKETNNKIPKFMV
jgi:hypothetical protein